MGKKNIFLVLACFAVFSHGYIREGPLYELLSRDFDSFMQEFRDDLRVVLFYGLFFGHGRSPSSELFSFAKNFPNKSVRFAKMNALNSTNTEVVQRFSRQNPPFMIYCLARTDKCLQYRGEVSSKDLSETLSDLIYNVEVLNNSLELEQLMDTKLRFGRLCLGVFEDLKSQEFFYFQNFTYENIGKYSFALAKDDGHWSHYFHLTSDSVVVISGSGLRHQLSEKHEALAVSRIEELGKFLDWTWSPFLSYVSPKNFFSFNTTEVPLVVLHLDLERYSELVESIVGEFVEVFKDKTVALYEDKKIHLALANVFDFTSEFSTLALNPGDMMILVYFKGNVYSLEKDQFFDAGTFFKDGLAEFMEAFYLGTLSPCLKSEKVPSQRFEKTIKVLVGSTISELLENQDTLHALLVYNPHHRDDYKKALDIFERLSDKYAKNYHLDFSKINLSLNSLPSAFSDRTENRVYLVHKSSVMQYSGKWDVDKLSDFFDTQLQKKRLEL